MVTLAAGSGSRWTQGAGVVKALHPFCKLKGRHRTLKVWENHYEEVKELPRDFILIAKEKHCSIQAMQHRALPIYGVQFHPEKMDPRYPDGERILRNFLNLK